MRKNKKKKDTGDKFKNIENLLNTEITKARKKEMKITILPWELKKEQQETYDKWNRSAIQVKTEINNQINKKDYSKDTIEVRVYNGTIDKHIIQNIVLFNENLLDYATSSRFDSEFINYKIKNYKKIVINDAIVNNPNVFEFSKLLFSDEKDI